MFDKIKAGGKLLKLAAHHGISTESPVGEVLDRIDHLSPEEMKEVVHMWDHLPNAMKKKVAQSPHIHAFVERTVKAITANGGDPAYVLLCAKAGVPVEGITLPTEIRDKIRVSVTRLRAPIIEVAFHGEGHHVERYKRDILKMPSNVHLCLFRLEA